MSRISRLLNSAVTVWRETLVDDGGGGWSSTWTQVGAHRARFSQPSDAAQGNATRVSADQSSALLTHTVYLEPDADVRRLDELRRDGKTYDVISVYEPSVPGTYLRADCEARQPENGGV